jgi:hypothetical protein
MKILLLCSVMLLALPAASEASIKDVLLGQVRSELKGDSSSCQAMSADYSQLYADAAAWFSYGDTCQAGVEGLFAERKARSGKHWKRQVRNELRAIGKGEVSKRGAKAKLVSRYKGTALGWTYRRKSSTVDIYQLVKLDGVWLVDSLKRKVDPPIARIAKD